MKNFAFAFVVTWLAIELLEDAIAAQNDVGIFFLCVSVVIVWAPVLNAIADWMAGTLAKKEQKDSLKDLEQSFGPSEK